MRIDVIHERLYFASGKDRGAWFTFEEVDRALEEGQMQRFQELIELYAIRQTIHNGLLPFKAKYDFTQVTTPGGVITMPAACEHPIGVKLVVVEAGVTLHPAAPILSEDEIGYRRSSQRVPPTAKHPVALYEKDKKIQLYPDVPAAGTVYYFKKPGVPKYAYTQVGRGVTYSDTDSIQMEWNDMEIVKHIIPKALQALGINTQAVDLVQFGQAKDKEV